MKSFLLILTTFVLTIGVATQISNSEKNLNITVSLEETSFRAFVDKGKDIQNMARILFRTELEANGINVVTINPDWKIVIHAVRVNDNYIIAPVISASLNSFLGLNLNMETDVYVYVFSEILEGENLPVMCHASVNHLMEWLTGLKKPNKK
jgi:hypothetical protein